MDSLEEIKKRKLDDLKKQQDQNQESQQMQQQVAQLEAIAKQVMTKEAIERYGNVRIAHPETALRALILIAQQIEAGRISRIEDQDLKNILKAIQPKKRDFNIKIK